eukprot:406147_1
MDIRCRPAVWSKLKCQADQSCNYANISSPYVTASGPYALYGSTVDTNHTPNGQLTVSLQGYQSGFGGKIICRSGDVCNIYCYFNGCQMLYLSCEDGNNCNIILNSNITIPPITHMNDFDDSLYDIKYPNYKTEQLCSKSSNNFVYDDENEQDANVYTNVSNGDPVCCRGASSCSTSGIIQITTPPYILICSGHNSCFRRTITITTSGSIFCEGRYACYYTNMIGIHNVYCLGFGACATSVISQSTNIYCSAERSCQYTQIQSNGTDITIYLLGRFSGVPLNISCAVGDECVIVCSGFESCSCTNCNYIPTRLYCNDNCLVYCNDDTGCPVRNYKAITPTSITSTSTRISSKSTESTAMTTSSENTQSALFTRSTLSAGEVDTLNTNNDRLFTAFYIAGPAIFLLCVILVIYFCYYKRVTSNNKNTQNNVSASISLMKCTDAPTTNETEHNIETHQSQTAQNTTIIQITADQNTITKQIQWTQPSEEGNTSNKNTAISNESKINTVYHLPSTEQGISNGVINSSSVVIDNHEKSSNCDNDDMNGIFSNVNQTNNHVPKYVSKQCGDFGFEKEQIEPNDINKIEPKNESIDEKKNDEIVKYSNVITDWSNNDIIEYWVNNLTLSKKWKQKTIDAITKSGIKGTDLETIKSKKHIKQLFDINNPMLNSRLWIELKKIKSESVAKIEETDVTKW